MCPTSLTRWNIKKESNITCYLIHVERLHNHEKPPKCISIFIFYSVSALLLLFNTQWISGNLSDHISPRFTQYVFVLCENCLIMRNLHPKHFYRDAKKIIIQNNHYSFIFFTQNTYSGVKSLDVLSWDSLGDINAKWTILPILHPVVIK